MAGDIHDALAQGFTSVIMLAQAAQAALDREDSGSARRQLHLSEEAARDGLSEARSLIGTLAPLALQGASLVAAIGRVGEDLGARFGFAARYEVEGEPTPLSNNAEIILVRAAQETLANVGRHASATSASVKLEFKGSITLLEVADDGVGFDASRPAGFGLSQLRSRATELGGSAEVTSAPGKGTTVRVTVPNAALLPVGGAGLSLGVSIAPTLSVPPAPTVTATVEPGTAPAGGAVGTEHGGAG